LLAGLRADADARLATAGAELLRLGQVVDDLTPLEVLGQRRTAVPVAPAPGLVGACRRPGPGALGAAAEAVLQGRIELAFQLGVLGAQPGQLGEQLPDHRL
jgi:hypothetical protein